MAKFRVLCASVNASFINGANYGMFNNSMDGIEARLLYFVDGVTFHFTPWRLLDDPSLLGATQFAATAPAFVAILLVQLMFTRTVLLKANHTYLYVTEDGAVDRKDKLKSSD
jgi:hypothetical protein